MHGDEALLKQAEEVLSSNDRGSYTQPAKGIYPHQWLWDSCFIAIGLRYINGERAKTELKSLLRGQWHNGMLPNIIFRDEPMYRAERNMWRSWLSPFAPNEVRTTGITQPPMLAEAVVQIGKKLGTNDRKDWYRSMYKALLAYHQWLYKERDPHGEGLILLIHPWEVGLDNTPPWMHELHEHLLPVWIRMVQKLKLDKPIDLLRRDHDSVPVNQRISTIEALAFSDIQRRLRRKTYDINRILDHSLFAIEDLNFNSIFIRANTHLRDIAKTINETLPAELVKQMNRTEKALENLWDDSSSQYYSRDFITHNLLKVPTIATLMPLYAGTISKEKAELLVRQIENEHNFGPAYPVPSVPVSSFWFNPKLYWQGPTWVNTNWLIIDGLKRYGFNDHAAALTESTIEMVRKNGFYEYFDPLSGRGAGTANFSWTAALIIDLIKSS